MVLEIAEIHHIDVQLNIDVIKYMLHIHIHMITHHQLILIIIYKMDTTVYKCTIILVEEVDLLVVIMEVYN